MELAAADDQGLLTEAEDLENLALCAQLTGRANLAEAAWQRAWDAFCDRGEVRCAVRCAFWLGMVLVTARGATARGSGWFARAHRLLDEQAVGEGSEWGYVLLPGALLALDGDDAGPAYLAFEEAASIGRRHADSDLTVLGRLGQGQCLIRLGDPTRGVALLDEAMLAANNGQVSPLASGVIYCAVLVACQQVFDVRRAQEWTEAFGTWCDAQPGLVPFRGQCLVHRSQLAQLRGDWTTAVTDADRACRWLSEPPDPAVGMAYYQRAELHRVQGEYAAAELAYQDAAQQGHDPHPGLALLWLAQDRTDAAVAAIRRVVDETSRAYPAVSDELRSPRPRAEALAAYVRIMLRAGRVEAAETACTELRRIADNVGTTVLTAMAGRATGEVLLTKGRPGPALEELVAARRCWMELRAPYETAQMRILVSRALRDLGDEETASIELAAADKALLAAGISRDLADLGDLGDLTLTSATPLAGPASSLTARELEVIRLVAAGHTNRKVAEQLFISDKTVARHLHNVLTKLDLPNRSAVTAFAYENHLAAGPVHRTV